MAITYLSGERIQGSSTAVGKTILQYTALSGTTFTPTSTMTAQYVIVAGGGGGNRGNGGAGGAGGYRTGTQSLTGGTAYTITVGAGGTGGANPSPVPTQGGNSSIAGSGLSTITATGGGFGGGEPTGSGESARDGGNGGSGGGSGTGSDGGAGNTPSTSPSQGYAGGDGVSGRNGGGGGGGASEVGADASSSSHDGGNGGDGIANPITNSTKGELSSGVYYLAGGGGGSTQSGTAGAGGIGGGGDGLEGTRGSANSGTDGTGGGGGGNANLQAGDGGNGVVILSFDTGAYSSAGNETAIVTTSDEKSALVNSDTYGTASWTGTGNAGSGTSSHDNYVRLPTNPVQAVTTSGSGTAFTIAFWVKSNNGFGGGADAFMGTYDGESSNGDHFQLYSHSSGLKLSDGSLHANWSSISTASISNNSWHHIALTRPASSSTVSAYLDGVLKTAADGDYAGRLTSNTSNSTWLKIGGRGDNNDNFPTMSMQDLGFWTREVSASDIAEMATGKPIEKITGYATGLTGYYKFDGDYTDSSSNTNTGIAGSDVSLASSGGKFDTYATSNLPTGTRYEEIDTRKIYRIKNGGWVEKGTA